MKLELESGDVFDDPDEDTIRAAIEGEGFAILGEDPMTYIQCAKEEEEPFNWVLEYQDGSLERHFRAVDAPVTLDRVVSAFIRYLRKDASWIADFEWETDDLTALE